VAGASIGAIDDFLGAKKYCQPNKINADNEIARKAFFCSDPIFTPIKTDV
jgi:hypothetical protein